MRTIYIYIYIYIVLIYIYTVPYIFFQKCNLCVCVFECLCSGMHMSNKTQKHAKYWVYTLLLMTFYLKFLCSILQMDEVTFPGDRYLRIYAADSLYI